MLAWIEQQESDFDKLQPIGADVITVMQQIDELEQVSTSVLPRHQQLEDINWTAGQLLSAAGVLDG